MGRTGGGQEVGTRCRVADISLCRYHPEWKSITVDQALFLLRVLSRHYRVVQGVWTETAISIVWRRSSLEGSPSSSWTGGDVNRAPLAIISISICSSRYLYYLIRSDYLFWIL